MTSTPHDESCRTRDPSADIVASLVQDLIPDNAGPETLESVTERLGLLQETGFFKTGPVPFSGGRTQDGGRYMEYDLRGLSVDDRKRLVQLLLQEASR